MRLKDLKLFMETRKGMDRYIWVVAMMVLGVLFIVLWFTAMEDWLTGLGDYFINEVVK